MGKTISIACMLWLAVCLAGSAHAQTLTPLDFAKHSEVNEVSLSPDGAYVSLARPSAEDSETQLQIVNLDGSGQVQALRFGKNEHVSDVIWTADRQLVIARAQTRPLRPRPVSLGQLFTSDISGKHQDVLFGYIPNRGLMTARRKDEGFAEVVDVLDDDPGIVMISFQCWDCGDEPGTSIYRVDTLRGGRKEVERSNKPARFMFDRKGIARVKVTNDEDDDPVIEYRTTPTAVWQPMPKSLAGYSIDAGTFDVDNNVLYAAVSDDGEPTQLFKLDLAAGTRQKLAGRDDMSIAGYETAGRKGIPFAVVFDAGKPSVQYLDFKSEWAQLHAGLMKTFPGQLVSFNEFSRDNNTVLFSARSDKQPANFYVLDRKQQKIVMVAESRPWMKPEQLASMRSIEFKRRDGQKLYGFYTAKDDTKRPLIVLPHGGPHGPYDTWGYDSDTQFFASLGYGVLQVNFRGSGGRGNNFQKEGYLEWGGKMQDDIADGVKWAIDNRLADPDRICTYGASFGGYAALMQPIRNRDMYKCAIGYVGVYDLTVMKKEGDITTSKSGRRYLDRVLGNDQAVLVANSPALNVDKVHVPVFLAQGSIDRRVPMDQLNAMKRGFAAAGVPVEVMVAPGEGHGFYKAQTQAELYQRTQAFLAKYLGEATK